MAFRDRVRSALSALTKERTPGAVIHNTIAESMPGVLVTDDMAMRFAAVHACIRVLSEDIASLPIHLFQRDKEGGKEQLRSHPLYELLYDRLNPEMTVLTLKECMMVNVLMTGNVYAFIEFSQAGQVISLWPMLSCNIYPYRSESSYIRYRCGQGISYHFIQMVFKFQDDTGYMLVFRPISMDLRIRQLELDILLRG